MSLKDISRIGMTVINRNVIVRKMTIACPVNGGITFRNDGRSMTVTTPRQMGDEVLDTEILESLLSPLLKDLTGCFVDHVATDDRGWTVLYLRARGKPLL